MDEDKKEAEIKKNGNNTNQFENKNKKKRKSKEGEAVEFTKNTYHHQSLLLDLSVMSAKFETIYETADCGSSQTCAGNMEVLAEDFARTFDLPADKSRASTLPFQSINNEAHEIAVWLCLLSIAVNGQLLVEHSLEETCVIQIAEECVANPTGHRV